MQTPSDALPSLVTTELLFVYNADSGLLNAAVDYFHKIISPATYSCSLCAVTYGNHKMRPSWQQFIAQLPVQVTFLHRDELHKQYPELTLHALPAAFYRSAGRPWRLFLPKDTLDHTDLPGLMRLVREQVATDTDRSAAQNTSY